MTRIARLETFATEFVCFVRLTTDDGHVGWGQTSTYNADITASIFHRQVAPWALGANALHPRGARVGCGHQPGLARAGSLPVERTLIRRSVELRGDLG